MDELTYLEKFYQLVRVYRVEVIFTFMIFVNPILTTGICGKWKNLTRKAGEEITDALMWRRAILVSMIINLPIAIRWGEIHWIDALMISTLVGVLVPWTVRGIMDWSHGTKRFHWVYLLLLNDRRRSRGQYNGEEKRRDERVNEALDREDPPPTLTTFSGD